MAKIKAYDIYAFNEMFDLKIKHALETLADYKTILLQNCKDSTSKTVDFDTEFMLNMAERGFINCIRMIHKNANESLQADIMIKKQLDEILKDPFDDED